MDLFYTIHAFVSLRCSDISKLLCNALNTPGGDVVLGRNPSIFVSVCLREVNNTAQGSRGRCECSVQEGGAGGRCRYSGRWCRIHPAGSRRAVANTDMMKKLCCEEKRALRNEIFIKIII